MLPREQGKIDPGRRGCGLLGTGTFFSSQALEIVSASTSEVIPHVFLSRKQRAFSVLALLSESGGAECKESLVPGFEFCFLADMLIGLGPAAAARWPVSLPINKEDGASPDPDLPSSLIRAASRRKETGEAQMNMEIKKSRPPLTAICHLPSQLRSNRCGSCGTLLSP